MVSSKDFKCIKNGSVCSYFTDSKVYKGKHIANGAYEVVDDHGIERVILDDEKLDPHLIAPYPKELRGSGYSNIHQLVGYFKVI